MIDNVLLESATTNGPQAVLWLASISKHTIPKTRGDKS